LLVSEVLINIELETIKGKKQMSENIIHPKAKIDENVFVDAYSVIGMGVTLEKDVYIAKGAKIYGKTLIKEETYIGENCVIGHPQRAQLSDIIKARKSPSEFEGPMTTIGKGCTIRANTIIYTETTIGDNCQTGHGAMIREKTIIGDDTIVGTNSIIDGNVTIGSNVSIQTGVYIPLFSTIGDNVFMGPYSKLTNDKYMMRKDFDLIGPTIEGYVSLGANSVIFPGITLKERTVVGAGSIVTKDTEESDIVVGNPAKRLKKIPDDWNK